ncbi:MAG: radical SAM family heme chaperone HemW [Thiobacillaceae bacterium]
MNPASIRSPGLKAPPPLALYIHIPWCMRKCPYCDFNSHAASKIPEAAYIDALREDLEAALPDIWGRKIHSVFFGGGTPSLFSPAGISRILDAVRMLTPLDPLAEITLEANPGTMEAGRFQDFRDAGVNRLSLGIQSFNDEKLESIGRIHGAAEARAAAELAARTFGGFNLDLMYGLPGQGVQEALDDVDIALDFNPSHLSCYHLTLEPNTPFGHTPPANLPDEDEGFAMQEAIEARLASSGFEHYETSAFALKSHRCRHNLNYWQFGDYLGIGAGAHSKLSFHDRIVRQMRVKHPRQYMEAFALGRRVAERVAEEKGVTAEELPFEFMMNALRLTGGFEVALFSERTGLPLNALLKPLAQAEARGLVTRSPLRIEPTLTGQRFLNDLLTLFLAG